MLFYISEWNIFFLSSPLPYSFWYWGLSQRPQHSATTPALFIWRGSLAVAQAGPEFVILLPRPSEYLRLQAWATVSRWINISWWAFPIFKMGRKQGLIQLFRTQQYFLVLGGKWWSLCSLAISDLTHSADQCPENWLQEVGFTRNAWGFNPLTPISVRAASLNLLAAGPKFTSCCLGDAN